MAGRLVRCLGASVRRPGFPFDVHRRSRSWCSTISFNEFEQSNVIEDEDVIPTKSELEPQGVDPRRGWGFRGVHKAIICGKIGQAPIQKILRNGKTVTIFTVGTGGMYDQRILGSENLPRPAQWHRIAVHNEQLGAYAVQQLTKNSPVFVEGDIETRVYNDSINGQVKNVPEICVRRDEEHYSEHKQPLELMGSWNLKEWKEVQITTKFNQQKHVFQKLSHQSFLFPFFSGVERGADHYITTRKLSSSKSAGCRTHFFYN